MSPLARLTPLAQATFVLTRLTLPRPRNLRARRATLVLARRVSAGYAFASNLRAPSGAVPRPENLNLSLDALSHICYSNVYNIVYKIYNSGDILWQSRARRLVLSIRQHSAIIADFAL